MSARRLPVGSSDTPWIASAGAGSDANSPTTYRGKTEGNKKAESASRRSYVTAARVRATEARLSPRHRAVVEDIARLRVLSGDQASRLHYGEAESDRRLARQDLARLVDWRVLVRLERRIGGVRAGSKGFVYGLDVVGQRISYSARQRYRAPWTPDAPFLAHAVAVAELYVQLRQHSGNQGFELLGFQAEPTCWRSFSGPGGRRLVLKPDAFLTSLSGDFEDRYFIEVDRNTESLPRITEKARLYASYWQSGQEQEAHGVFPQVLWIAPTQERRDRIVEALARLEPEHWQLFATTTAEEAAALIWAGTDRGEPLS